MTRKQIYKITQKWIPLLNLQAWDIYVTYKNFKEHQKGVYVGVVFTESNPRYLTATITFHKKWLKNITEHEIIHELLHVVCSELHGYYEANGADKWADYFEERIVSHLENVIWKMKK